MNFTTNVYKSSYTFDEILDCAHKWFEKLPKNKKESLKHDLDHGAGNLDSDAQLKAYLHFYGKIHQAKLLLAFEKIPHKIWSENEVSIIDYGCGQGLAEMVFSDFISSKCIDNDFVKDITLIEPSRENLIQAVEYVKAFYFGCQINSFCITDDQIKEDHIKPSKENVIHIFSNIIDLESFDGDKIAYILSQDKSRNNVIICVSPYYQDDTRGKRMGIFGKKRDTYKFVCLKNF